MVGDKLAYQLRTERGREARCFRITEKTQQIQIPKTIKKANHRIKLRALPAACLLLNSIVGHPCNKIARKGGGSHNEVNKTGVSINSQPCAGIGRSSEQCSYSSEIPWFAAEVPVIVLLFLTAAGGFVSGLLAALLARSGAKS